MFLNQFYGLRGIQRKLQRKLLNIMPLGAHFVLTINKSKREKEKFLLVNTVLFSFYSVVLVHFVLMMKTFTLLLFFSLFLNVFFPFQENKAHAQTCLGPAQQQQAISSGKAKRFGVVARLVSNRLNSNVIGGQLCHRGNRLVYILTIVKTNGQAGRVIVDARSGR